MAATNSVYEALKGQVYDIAQVATGRSNGEARTEGFRDVYDIVMSDSDHPRQLMFTTMSAQRLSEKQCVVLLDGLAREYADCDGWDAYVMREG